MSNIKCGNCKATHTTVNEVRACYGQPPVKGLPMSEAYSGSRSTPVTTNPVVVQEASEKQVVFIAKLRAERGFDVLPFGGSKGQASKEISRLLTLPKAVVASTAKASTPGTQADPEDGMYRKADGSIFKVYRTVHGANIQACKLLLVDADAKTGKFVYQGMARRFVNASEKMTLEEAKEFGVLYGFCCKCGRTLTDENSIAAGIGPVCAGKGW